MNEHDEALRKQTAFLGQPKGVGTLSFMQLCNSFANYAMSAVLIYLLIRKCTGRTWIQQGKCSTADLFIFNSCRTDRYCRKLCLRPYLRMPEVFIYSKITFIYRICMPCITTWRSWLWNRYGMSGNRTDVRWQMSGCSSWKIL